MKRIWINYNKWEDYKNGLYSTVKQANEEELIASCIELLCSEELFFNTGLEMMVKWPDCSSHNLSDVKANRKSYLGQAVCNFYNGSSIKTVVKAWNCMDIADQNKANEIALKLIDFYESEYGEI